MSTPLPHFEISRELFSALDYKEVMATIEALQECGQLHLPYPLQTVRFNMEDYAVAPGWGQDTDRKQDCWITFEIEDYMRWTPKETMVKINPVLIAEQIPHGVIVVDTEHERWTLDGRVHRLGNDYHSNHNREVARTWRNTCAYVSRLLVAALATKNVVKHIAVNKRAARGIGSGKFRGATGIVRASCTRLDVPHEYTESGRRVRFHMRRGHYHHFRTGKGRVGRVRKFIPPILVNKDAAVADVLLNGAVTAPTYAVSP